MHLTLSAIVIFLICIFIAHHARLRGETTVALVALGLGLYFVWPGWLKAAYDALVHAWNAVPQQSSALVTAAIMLGVILWACKKIFVDSWH